MAYERFDPATKIKMREFLERGVQFFRLHSQEVQGQLDKIALELEAISNNALQEAGRLYSELSLEDKSNLDISPADLARSVMP